MSATSDKHPAAALHPTQYRVVSAGQSHPVSPPVQGQGRGDWSAQHGGGSMVSVSPPEFPLPSPLSCPPRYPTQAVASVRTYICHQSQACLHVYFLTVVTESSSLRTGPAGAHGP